MTARHHSSRTSQRGLSMIELMVALLLSTLLLLGVLQMFSNSSHTSKVSTALIQVQDSGRVVLDMIASDARRAGYQGCVMPSNIVTVSNGTKFPRDAIVAVTGNNTSITFNYAVTTNTGVAMPGTNKGCTNGTTPTLYLYSVTYSNCTNGISICMNSTTSGGTQTIVDGAQITAFSLGYPSGANYVWKPIGSITTAQIQSADRLQVSLTATESSQNVTRSFVNTIELRNRP